MNTIGQLYDPGAMAIVLAGTTLATLARSGWRNLWAAARTALRMDQPRFEEDANRVALARTAAAIRREGVLCADVPLPPDPALAQMVGAYLRHGSPETLHAVRRAGRATREITRERAVRVFEYAGELAPVFGLVGTLLAVTSLMPDAQGKAKGSLAVIASAALSTIYGVLLAHLVCIPLARRIERAGEREEAARDALAEWLDRQLLNHKGAPPARLRGVA